MNDRPEGERAGGAADASRLFVAVELPDTLRFRLVELRKDFSGLRWAVPENMHLTLRFVGEVGRKDVEKARKALREVRVAPFFLCVQGLGLFERGRRHVLWAGLKTSAPLSELKRRVDGVLAESIGLGAEQGPFTPHITLSRIRTGLSPALREQAAGCDFASESFAVESFTLFRSVLSSAGASHFPLEQYPLLTPGM